MSDNSFWAEKFNETVQQHVPDTLPAPTIPQAPAPAVEELDDDESQAQWMARNARQVETGSDFMSVSGNTRTWEANSRQVSNTGIFGKQGRRARAELNQNIRSGRYNETSRGGDGALGSLGLDSSPRAAAATISALTRDGAFDTDRGDMDIISR